MKAGAGPGAGEPDLPDATNVLLLASAATRRRACLDALARSPPAETRVLVVSYTDSPEEWIQAWDDHVGAQPAGGAILVVGGDDGFEDGHWQISSIESPGDLTGTGIELSSLLSTLVDEAGAEERIVVCFDSVTTLLDHADLQRAFRFLHVVTGRVRSADARCYYHLDPAAHDEQARATLAGLFDATLGEDDGT